MNIQTKIIKHGRERFQASICPFCVGGLAIAPSEAYNLHRRIWHSDAAVAMAERKYFNLRIGKMPYGSLNREFEHGTWQD